MYNTRNTKGGIDLISLLLLIGSIITHSSYLYYIGLTNIKEDIPKEDLSVLIEKCNELGGEYTDPIELGKSLANEIYQKNNVSIDDIKSLKIDEFYNWYNDGREIGNSLEIESLDEREVN